jgi:threonine/homoserine efflux transporter RhtA
METLLWTGFATLALATVAAAAPYHQRMIAARRIPRRSESRD